MKGKEVGNGGRREVEAEERVEGERERGMEADRRERQKRDKWGA
jgi:hypothetical protein